MCVALSLTGVERLCMVCGHDGTKEIKDIPHGIKQLQLPATQTHRHTDTHTDTHRHTHRERGREGVSNDAANKTELITQTRLPALSYQRRVPVSVWLCTVSSIHVTSDKC